MGAQFRSENGRSSRSGVAAAQGLMRGPEGGLLRDAPRYAAGPVAQVSSRRAARRLPESQ